MAAMVFTNLLYVVGAIVAATVISALILLRHRRPRSLEAGIELFSRELRALAPDSRTGRPGGDDEGSRLGGPAGGPARRGSGQPQRVPRNPSNGEGAPGRGAPSPDTEQQSG